MKHILSLVALQKQKLRGHPAPKPTMDELLADRERLNRVSADFLKVDLETALTFVKIARDTHDNSRRNRNLRAARKAYDTVHAFVRKIALKPEDTQVIKGRMAQLKNELEALGEEF